MSTALKGLDRLLRLQELDLSVDRMRNRRDVLEAGQDVRTTRQQVEEAESRLGEVRLELDGVDRESRRLEGDIDSLTRKARAEEGRLYDGSVVNPKELEAIQHEVASLRARRSRLEDNLIELMEQKEALDERLAAAQAEAQEMRDRLTEVLGESAAELSEIGQSLASRTVEREGLVLEFDPELLELYEDLRRQKKGVGAAALVDGVCQGCHQKLSAMELDRLKRTEGVKRCEYCRRILIDT
ncbi:MAG: YscO family type III secretion system apparatus protein [Actinomycetota bacterium]|nr:YscO family type III secretion system apparatus protein [Actinomycetota bacterium]